MLVSVRLFGFGVSPGLRQRQLKSSAEGVLVAFGAEEFHWGDGRGSIIADTTVSLS